MTPVRLEPGVSPINIGAFKTLWLQGNFACFLSFADFFSSKPTFSKNSFRNTIRGSISLDPDQARHFIELDLGPNYLQRLSADDTSRRNIIVCLYGSEHWFEFSMVENTEDRFSRVEALKHQLQDHIQGSP